MVAASGGVSIIVPVLLCLSLVSHLALSDSVFASQPPMAIVLPSHQAPVKVMNRINIASESSSVDKVANLMSLSRTLSMLPGDTPCSSDHSACDEQAIGACNATLTAALGVPNTPHVVTIEKSGTRRAPLSTHSLSSSKSLLGHLADQHSPKPTSALSPLHSLIKLVAGLKQAGPVNHYREHSNAGDGDEAVNFVVLPIEQDTAQGEPKAIRMFVNHGRGPQTSGKCQAVDKNLLFLQLLVRAARSRSSESILSGLKKWVSGVPVFVVINRETGQMVLPVTSEEVAVDADGDDENDRSDFEKSSREASKFRAALRRRQRKRREKALKLRGGDGALHLTDGLYLFFMSYNDARDYLDNLAATAVDGDEALNQSPYEVIAVSMAKYIDHLVRVSLAYYGKHSELSQDVAADVHDAVSAENMSQAKPSQASLTGLASLSPLTALARAHHTATSPNLGVPHVVLVPPLIGNGRAGWSNEDGGEGRNVVLGWHEAHEDKMNSEPSDSAQFFRTPAVFFSQPDARESLLRVVQHLRTEKGLNQRWRGIMRRIRKDESDNYVHGVAHVEDLLCDGLLLSLILHEEPDLTRFGLKCVENAKSAKPLPSADEGKSRITRSCDDMINHCKTENEILALKMWMRARVDRFFRFVSENGEKESTKGPVDARTAADLWDVLWGVELVGNSRQVELAADVTAAIRERDRLGGGLLNRVRSLITHGKQNLRDMNFI
eukprot:GHVN01090268.1.p1 GENE.GHVN01090268.1~~GHVN01090268.1.p1  ORF type:complete len:721 (+),score=109.61 GHVN01090268.1:74-2236(+)